MKSTIKKYQIKSKLLYFPTLYLLLANNKNKKIIQL